MADLQLSAPRSTPSVASFQDNDDYMGNGLMLELAPFGFEKIYDYETGGHHPVHLGDVIGSDRRYRVIHKLGSGGFANVWLCRNLNDQVPRYVALKILMAEASTDDCREFNTNKIKNFSEEVGGKYISLPLDHFKIYGPNGLHFCFVYPVAGPRFSWIIKKFEDPEKSLRKVSLHVVQAMSFLHGHGICHGDLTPSNVLLKVSGLDSLDESEVIRALGEPRLNKVVPESDDVSITPRAPQYLVRPVDFGKVDSRFITDEACIIDFGESFDISNPPDDLGIPQMYCSPELVLDKVAGVGSDIWALGCTIFEIRTGRRLFDNFDDDVDEHMFSMALLLGKLPEPWWTTTWEERKNWFEDEADSQGRVISLKKLYNRSRSIEDALARGLGLLESDMLMADSIERDISAKEVAVLGNLLRKVLQYNPSDRITAQAMQDHEWFKL